MSDVTDLIEEARAVGRSNRQHPYAGLVGRLAGELEATREAVRRAEFERDEARAKLDAVLPMVKAVVEQVAEHGEDVAGHVMVDGDLLFQLCSALVPGQEDQT